jgi:hypothetical protein
MSIQPDCYIQCQCDGYISVRTLDGKLLGCIPRYPPQEDFPQTPIGSVAVYAAGTGFPIGCGYWTQGNTESCLLATRSKPQRLSRAVHRLILSPRREHSRKPDEVYDRIETLCPEPYLELFARCRRPGWDDLGHEVQTGIGQRRSVCSSPTSLGSRSHDVSGGASRAALAN